MRAGFSAGASATRFTLALARGAPTGGLAGGAAVAWPEAIWKKALAAAVRAGSAALGVALGATGGGRLGRMVVTGGPDQG
jgi:hypothetical protein